MHLSQQDVCAIATYTRIGLTASEVEDMTRDLNNIIESLHPITAFNLAGVEPTFHPIAGLANVMRDDVEAPGLAHCQALAAAPAEQDGQFKIPAILGGDGGDR